LAIREQRLAQQWRPIKREKGADAAKGKGRHQTDRKRKTQSDDPQAIARGFQGEAIEPPTDAVGRPAKQPFDDDAQPDKKSEQQQRLGSPVFTEVRADERVTSPVLVRQIGNRAGESSEVLADCRETPIHSLRNGLLRGGLLCCGLHLALFFKPIAHLRIAEQSHQFLDLLRRRLFARRRRRWLLCRCETAARQRGCENHGPKKDHRHSPGDPNDPFAIVHWAPPCQPGPRSIC
jgi:hypothetical protein